MKNTTNNATTHAAVTTSVGAEVKKLDPVVSARVPEPMRDRIDALRPLFPRPDGKTTPRSDVLRAMLMQGEAMFDARIVLAVRRLADARGCEVSDAWAWVIAEGLRSCRERLVAEPTNSTGTGPEDNGTNEEVGP
jgi:hypothetical protein